MASLFFVFFVPLGAFPDEKEHWRLIEEMSKGPIFYKPFINSVLEIYGPLDVKSFLYYKISGLLLNLFGDFKLTILAIRIQSFIAGVLYLTVSYKIIKTFFCEKSLYSILATLSIACTYAFINLSSSVSWDSYANLFSLCSIYFLLLLIKNLNLNSELNLRYLINFGIFSLLAILSKWTSFLILSILCFILLIGFIRKYKTNYHILWDSNKYLIAIRSILLLSLFICSCVFYYPIFLKYGSASPSCPDVWGLKKCMECCAQTRAHYGLILENKNLVYDGIFKYLGTFLRFNFERLFGFFGHARLQDANRIIYLGLPLIFFLSPLFFIKQPDKKTPPIIYYAIFIILSYFIIYFIQNYLWYSQIKVRGAAIQGRYLLPVFPLAVGFFYYYIENCRFKKLSIFISFFIPLLFFLGGFGLDIFNANINKIIEFRI